MKRKKNNNFARAFIKTTIKRNVMLFNLSF